MKPKSKPAKKFNSKDVKKPTPPPAKKSTILPGSAFDFTAPGAPGLQ